MLDGKIHRDEQANSIQDTLVQVNHIKGGEFGHGRHDHLSQTSDRLLLQIWWMPLYSVLHFTK